MLSLRERAQVLREAADVLQPLLASRIMHMGHFRWMCASQVALAGLRIMGRTE